MMKTLLAAALALILGGNGLAMMLAGPWWYLAVPGVLATGPFNPHFVKDIGAAYLACAGALAWSAFRPASGRSGLMVAATFLGLHAAVHVNDEICGAHGVSAFVRDFPGVFAPALLTAALALARRREPRKA